MAHTTNTRQERGDVVLVVFAIIILALAGALGYWLWQRGGNSKTVSACASLSLSEGSASGAAGTIYKNAVVTNTGKDDCTLTGYPGVFMIDSGGTQVGSGAAANSLYAAATITLAPGGKAHTVVAFPQQSNFDPGVCSGPGATMKLYAPGIATALSTSWSDYSCPGFSATAFRAGASE